jgi:hypothetical protein
MLCGFARAYVPEAPFTLLRACLTPPTQAIIRPSPQWGKVQLRTAPSGSPKWRVNPRK